MDASFHSKILGAYYRDKKQESKMTVARHIFWLPATLLLYYFQQ